MSWVYAFHSALIPACAVARLELNTPRLRRRVVIENSVELNSNSTRTALLCSFARLHSLWHCVYIFFAVSVVSNSTALYESSRVCLSSSPMRYGFVCTLLPTPNGNKREMGMENTEKRFYDLDGRRLCARVRRQLPKALLLPFFSSSVNGASQQLSVVVKYTTEKG